MPKYSEPFDKKHLRQQVGPHYLSSGHIVVPARDDEPAEAAEFWASQGFQRLDDGWDWRRRAKDPKDGKVYDHKAWLQATRRKYAEFYDWKPASKREEARLIFQNAGGLMRAWDFYNWYQNQSPNKAINVMTARLIKEFSITDTELKRALRSAIAHVINVVVHPHESKHKAFLEEVHSCTV